MTWSSEYPGDSNLMIVMQPNRAKIVQEIVSPAAENMLDWGRRLVGQHFNTVILE
jgi:hypothetical protein